EPIPAPRSGYVQHCDMPALQRLAEAHDLQINVLARPGAYATPVKPLMTVEGTFDEAVRDELCDCFVVGESRTFESDPRYGMIVLGEIGDKAMSAGINDPGTGIVVIDTAARLLLDWKEEPVEVRYDRIHVQPIRPADVLD